MIPVSHLYILYLINTQKMYESRITMLNAAGLQCKENCFQKIFNSALNQILL